MPDFSFTLKQFAEKFPSAACHPVHSILARSGQSDQNPASVRNNRLVLPHQPHTHTGSMSCRNCAGLCRMVWRLAPLEKQNSWAAEEYRCFFKPSAIIITILLFKSVLNKSFGSKIKLCAFVRKYYCLSDRCEGFSPTVIRFYVLKPLVQVETCLLASKAVAKSLCRRQRAP